MINSVKCPFEIKKNHSINITTIDIKRPVISSFKESSEERKPDWCVEMISSLLKKLYDWLQTILLKTLAITEMTEIGRYYLDQMPHLA